MEISLSSIVERLSQYNKLACKVKKDYNQAKDELIRTLAKSIGKDMVIIIHSAKEIEIQNKVYNDYYYVPTTALLNWISRNQQDKIEFFRIDEIKRKYDCDISNLTNKYQELINNISIQEEKYIKLYDDLSETISQILVDDIFVSEINEHNDTIFVNLSRFIGEESVFQEEIGADIVYKNYDERYVGLTDLINLLEKLERNICVDDFNSFQCHYL